MLFFLFNFLSSLGKVSFCLCNTTPRGRGENKAEKGEEGKRDISPCPVGEVVWWLTCNLKRTSISLCSKSSRVQGAGQTQPKKSKPQNL